MVFVICVNNLIKLVNAMATNDQPIQIIGNESNSVTEIETGSTARAAEQNAMEKTGAVAQAPLKENQHIAAQRSNNEIATNDGAVIETLDTALHNKPGVAEGETVSGSNRADYYESRPYGKSDAEEELDALNTNQP